MGISNDYKMKHLGEFSNIRTENGVALTLPCHFDENTRLSIIIQNKLGSAVFEDNFELTSSDDKLEIKIPDVTGGDYTAWIDVNGQVSIRNIHIGPRPSSGIIGWFKSKLS